MGKDDKSSKRSSTSSDDDNGDSSCGLSVFVSSIPGILLTLAGCVIVVLHALEKIGNLVIEGCFMALYSVAFLGLLAVFLLHACGKLTTSKVMADKKAGFYRVGVLVLGSGGLIYQIINLEEMGRNITTAEPGCRNYVGFSKTFLAVLVTVMQVLFLVKFVEVRVNYSRPVATFSRLVMCHMVATNLCVWFRTIVAESLHVMHHNDHESHHGDDSHGETHHDDDDHFSHQDDHHNNTHHPIPALTTMGPLSMTTPLLDHNVTAQGCSFSNPMGTLFSPYTFPLLIEFSILVIGLYVNVIEGSIAATAKTTSDDDHHDHDHSLPQHVHHNTFEGLILGWLSGLIALTVILYMLYDSYSTEFDPWKHVFEIYTLSLVLAVIGLLAGLVILYRMTDMVKFTPRVRPQDKRENGLLVTTCVCMVIYKVCCFIASIYESRTNGTMTADAILSILSGILSTYLIIYHIPHRRLKSAGQRAVKPGRQSLEVLRCTNFALWLINTFLLKSVMSIGPLEDTFGDQIWPIVSNIVQPMTILFHFHGVMCLSHAIAHAHTWHVDEHVESSGISKIAKESEEVSDPGVYQVYL